MVVDGTELARGILTNSAQIDGFVLRLTCGQLPRQHYAAVNKALEALGGKWNRKLSGHVFDANPSAALAAFLGGAVLPKPARTAEGYVPTPAALAARIVAEHTDIGDLVDEATVLEPSAGDGPFVRAVLDANPGITVVAVEPNADRLAKIGAVGAQVVNSTFEDFAQENAGRLFDAVVMNPPFTVPGRPSVWIDHVLLAEALLVPGGRLTAIVPVSLLERRDRRHSALRGRVEQRGGFVPLPDDAFKTSGTGVRTVVMWLRADL